MRIDYSVKPPSSGSELGPHQDFSIVDEESATSLYVWIPLCDTDEVNGTLHVVPGSHRFGNAIRSRHVPAVFDEVLDQVAEAAVRLDCRAGELIVMVSGVIHFSPPNRSTDLRLAAHGIVTPEAVPLVFYFADETTPAGKVECYELGMERYIEQIHRGRPGADVALTRLVERPETSMSPERFASGMAEYRRGCDAGTSMPEGGLPQVSERPGPSVGADAEVPCGPSPGPAPGLEGSADDR